MRRYDFLPGCWMAEFKRRPGDMRVELKLRRDDGTEMDLAFEPETPCEDWHLLEAAQRVAVAECATIDFLRPMEPDDDDWEAEGEEWKTNADPSALPGPGPDLATE